MKDAPVKPEEQATQQEKQSMKNLQEKFMAGTSGYVYVKDYVLYQDKLWQIAGFFDPTTKKSTGKKKGKWLFSGITMARWDFLKGGHLRMLLKGDHEWTNAWLVSCKHDHTQEII